MYPRQLARVSNPAIKIIAHCLYWRLLEKSTLETFAKLLEEHIVVGAKLFSLGKYGPVEIFAAATNVTRS